MPTKGSREQDDIVRKAMKDYQSGEVEYPCNDRVNAAGPHHYDKGSIGGGSNRRGLVDPGEGRPGAADERGA